MSARETPTDHDLLEQLRRLDGRGYPAYKDLRGSYAFPRFAFHVDHVQGDPFAAPSRVHVVVPAEVAGLPASGYAYESRAIGTASFLTEQFDRAARRVAGSGGTDRLGSGKSGRIEIEAPGQAVIARTSV
ncbi:MAG: ATPase, partial [Gemmatimonadetes bacterium]|nr:ATPase [Gemmatimonadota bacterium]